MFERPSVKFAMGGLIGGLSSLTISVGLMPFFVTVAFALFVGVAWRAHSVLSGVLCGFGVTWLVLIGGSEAMEPFLVIAGVVFLTGVAVGLLGIVRYRARSDGFHGRTI